MTSLVPGAIFQTTGFNRNSTPTPPNATPSQLDGRYNRADFDGRPWPHESPVSRVYDVRNTSTKMIILNNKHGKSGTRLRGYYTGPQKPDRSVDPNRHRAQSPRNLDHHVSCYDTSTPKFEPTIRVNLDWYNNLRRPDNALEGRKMRKTSKDKQREELRLDLHGSGSNKSRLMIHNNQKRSGHGLQVKTSVNPRRHTSCQTPRETIRFPPEEKQRIPLPPARFFSAKEFSDMSLGEKIYMWSIEKIYNVENLKRLKQDQYKKLLQLEAKKGYHGFQQYQKYMRYINNASSRSYGTGSPRSPHSPTGSRARSAFSSRSATSPTKLESKQDGASNKTDSEAGEPARPKTAMGITRPESPSKKETDRTATEKDSDQKLQSKSPSPSRKSSARSSRSSASTRSVKSRTSARPPSTSSRSSKRSESLHKADHSDSSLSVDGDTGSKHKEGRDRPKSRLGHMSAEDRDKGVVNSSLSSLSSIRSDKHSSSEDSGLEKDKAKNKKQDSQSNSSRSSRVSGSNSSLGSRRSDNGHRPWTNGTKRIGSFKQGSGEDMGPNDNENTKDKDTKIHNVPSGGFPKENKEVKKAQPMEHESKEQENPEETPNNKQTENERKDESKKESNINQNQVDKGEYESNIKMNEDHDNGSNSKDMKPENVNSNDRKINGAQSTEGKEKLLERQDSLEEDDEDRKVNKDLDKIEY